MKQDEELEGNSLLAKVPLGQGPEQAAEMLPLMLEKEPTHGDSSAPER